MNLLRHSFVLIVMLFFSFAVHAADISFDKSDFSSAKKIQQNGQTVIAAILNEEGFSKMKRLNNTRVGQQVEVRIAGEARSLKLREPIKGHELQFGPFSHSVAEKIIAEVNGQ